VVAVKLDGSVKTADGIDLPKGTELIGKVADVKSAGKDGAVSVSLIFTTAELKDGKQISVKATVLAAYPPSQGIEGDGSADQAGPAPARVSGNRSFAEEPGALRHIWMRSAVKDEDSGTFGSTKGSFRLAAGTYLQIGIAPAETVGTSSAAE
jgi:hypothetical protein